MSLIDAVAKFEGIKGKKVICSDWLEIDRERIDQYVTCTGDHQWIHVDVTSVVKGPFGQSIAHGFLCRW